MALSPVVVPLDLVGCGNEGKDECKQLKLESLPATPHYSASRYLTRLIVRTPPEPFRGFRLALVSFILVHA